MGGSGGSKQAGDVPNLVDDDISVDAITVDTVESEVVWDVMQRFDFDKHEDARELTAVEAGVLEPEQVGEAGDAGRHTPPVPQL